MNPFYDISKGMVQITLKRAKWPDRSSEKEKEVTE